tara:strand:- start:14955 stop:16124 length:1170 start_codon:yes stop_codon:yes gene_type:complete
MDNIKETIEEINSQIEAKNQEIKESINEKASNESVKTLTDELSELKEVAKRQGEALKNINVAKESALPLTFSDALKNAFEDSQEKIKSVKSGTANGTGEISIKEVSSASVIDSTASYYIAGIGQLPVRRAFLDSEFAHGSVGFESGGTITYWDQNVLERNASNVGECDAIPESSIDWKEYSVTFTKVADSIPVCAEAMEDYAFIESEVKNFLLVNVLLQNDANILAGVDTAAQTWVAGAFAGALTTPTTFDVIKIGKSQIENSGQNNSYAPNVVLMNPQDYTSMMLAKTTDGQYLFPMYMSSAEMIVDGLKIITSSLVPQDILYILDSSKGTIYDHRGLSLDYASEHGEDFLHDRIRLRATLRKAFVIRNVNANAFLKVDSIAGAIAAL